MLVNAISDPHLVDPASKIDTMEHGHVERIAIECAYPERHEARLRTLGDDRVLLLQLHVYRETWHAHRLSWEPHLETLEALVSGQSARAAPASPAGTELIAIHETGAHLV